MMKRLVSLFLIAPIAIILLVLAVSNRQPVSVAVPPYAGDAPFLSLSMPLFALVFGSLLVGLILGSFITWWRQGSYRKEARRQKVEATKWHFEADKEKQRAETLAQKVVEKEGGAPRQNLPSLKRAS